MLHYINVTTRDYYQNGATKNDYSFTELQADQETVSTIVGGFVKLAGIGMKALVVGSKNKNRYCLPRYRR